MSDYCIVGGGTSLNEGSRRLMNRIHPSGTPPVNFTKRVKATGSPQSAKARTNVPAESMMWPVCSLTKR